MRTRRYGGRHYKSPRFFPPGDFTFYNIDLDPDFASGDYIDYWLILLGRVVCIDSRSRFGILQIYEIAANFNLYRTF